VARSAAGYTIDRTTPPSTRTADPVVAEAGSLHKYTIMAATSSVVAKPLSKLVGRASLKNARSVSSLLLP
jgi:hypothetical protein